MGLTDLKTELQNGVNLVNFFEILTNKVIERYYKAPKNKMQMIENLNLSLNFLEREIKIRNPGCSAPNIYDCDVEGFKNVLGMLFLLYREFRMKIDTTEKVPGKKVKEEDALLDWAREVVIWSMIFIHMELNY